MVNVRAACASLCQALRGAVLATKSDCDAVLVGTATKRVNGGYGAVWWVISVMCQLQRRC